MKPDLDKLHEQKRGMPKVELPACAVCGRQLRDDDFAYRDERGFLCAAHTPAELAVARGQGGLVGD